MMTIRCTVEFVNEENAQNEEPSEELPLQRLTLHDRQEVEERLGRIDEYKKECFEEARSMLKRPLSSTK